MPKQPTANDLIHRVLTDPCASFWLKHSLETAVQRDMLDALRDAEQLAALLKQRFMEMSMPAVDGAATVEDLQEIKRARYEMAGKTGILCLVGKVARVLGENIRTNYGPKYRYSTPDLEIFVDDFGHYMTVHADGKQVCSTHPNDRLFVPGPWLAAVQQVYPMAFEKLTVAESERHIKAFNELARELGME